MNDEKEKQEKKIEIEIENEKTEKYQRRMNKDEREIIRK